MARTTTPTFAQLQALITGVPEYCAPTVFSVSGQTFTAAQAVAFLTTVQNAGAAIAASRAAWRAAIQAAEKSNAGDGLVAREIRQAVTLQFSNAPTTLNALAITPRKKPKPLTGAARAAAAAKAAATRKARGTESKKKKALITGNVTGVIITPTTSPPPTPASGRPSRALRPPHLPPRRQQNRRRRQAWHRLRRGPTLRSRWSKAE